MTNAVSRSAWLCLAWVAASCLPGAILIRESLWIDELHSAWVVGANWEQFLPRVTEGNQQPAYFAILKLWSGIWGAQGEIAFRSLSLIAWGVAIFFVHRTCQEFRVLSERRQTAAWLIAAGVWFDRTNHFYAVEARPYSLIVAMSSIAIWSTIRLTRVPQLQSSARAAWCLSLAVIAVFHVTALFVVIAAVVARVALSKDSRRFADSIGVLTVTSVPVAMQLFSDSFAQRHLWNTFASTTSVWQVVTLLPFAAWLVVPALGAAASLVFRHFNPIKPHNLTQRFCTMCCQRNGLLFWSAFLFATIPLVGCWAVTVSGLGALMHSRYLIGAYPALLVCAYAGLSAINKRSILIVVGCVGLLVLLFSQSTFKIWQNGELFGWQRQENWRASIRHVQLNKNDSETIFFSSQLIEASDLNLRSDRYFRFPIESIYECQISKQIVLVSNDLREIRPDSRPSNGGCLLIRMKRSQLQNRLQELDLTAANVVSYGNLQVVRW